MTGSMSKAGGSIKYCITILVSTFLLSGRVTRALFLPVVLDAVSVKAVTVLLSLHLRQGHET